MPASNTDANPGYAGLKNVRAGFHVAGYTARTLGTVLANKLSGGLFGKLTSKIDDKARGYTRISKNDNVTFDIGGQQVQLPAKFMGEKLPPGKSLQALQTEVQAKITEGERLLHQIENGTAPQQCSLKNMTDLMTYMQARAQAQHGNFNEGSMSIPDPGNRIKAFLDTCPDAYQRKSSHISDFQNQANAQGTHRGIDAYGRTRNPDAMLPNNMKTVMYGTMSQSVGMKMPEQRLWLKMEPHGAWAFSPKVNDPNGPKRSANAHDGKAAVGHTFSFLETRGQGSKAGTRKERIPDDIKKAWGDFQKEARRELAGQNPPQALTDMLRKGEGVKTAQGVRFLNDYLNTLKNSPQLSQATRDKAAYMQSAIKSRFPQDTMNVRIGNEVILKDTDLRPRQENQIPQHAPQQQQGMGALGNQVARVARGRGNRN
jgi:hypothetical protein